MKNRVLVYGVLLVALLALPILYVINEGTDLRRLDPHKHEIQNLLSYVLLILFSYMNYTVFVPRWYLAKRYVRYAAVVIGCALGVAYIPHRIEQWAFLKPPAENTLLGWSGQLLWKENLFPPRPQWPGANEHRPPPPPGRRKLPEALAGGPPPDRRRPPEGARFLIPPPLAVKLGIILLLCSVSALASISVQTNNRLKQIENEKLNAELLQLKAQIHPHFLFNTLNSIYALAIRKDDRTAETIVKLSDFMRYMIRDAHHNKVALEKETAYISNYIDLQRARLRDSVPIDYALEGDVAGQQIAPLLLFSFIENAFKHGVNPDEDSLIRIELRVQADELRLHVFNHKVRTNHIEASNGVGLQNAKDRLRLLYPASHQLTIDDAPNYFRVDLTLKLT